MGGPEPSCTSLIFTGVCPSGRPKVKRRRYQPIRLRVAAVLERPGGARLPPDGSQPEEAHREATGVGRESAGHPPQDDSRRADGLAQDDWHADIGARAKLYVQGDLA